MDVVFHKIFVDVLKPECGVWPVRRDECALLWAGSILHVGFARVVTRYVVTYLRWVRARVCVGVVLAVGECQDFLTAYLVEVAHRVERHIWV